jgi:hypothetical protein
MKPSKYRNGAVKWELDGESRRSKVLCNIAKYWYRILLLECVKIAVAERKPEM